MPPAAAVNRSSLASYHLEVCTLEKPYIRENAPLVTSLARADRHVRGKHPQKNCSV